MSAPREADQDVPGGLRALAEDRMPTRDLWPQIAARIESGESVTLPPELERAMATLPREVAPQRELWTGIAARIQRPRRRWRGPWLAAAASVAGLATVLGLNAMRDEGVHHAPLRAPASFLVDEGGRDAALLRASNRPLRSETRALVRANLKIVKGAEAQLQRALDAEPDAIYLRSLLDTTQAQRRELNVVLAAAEPTAPEH